MSDLISRSEVWKAFISRVDSICDLGDVREILDSIPTAEPTIDLVRCGECKYWDGIECQNDRASTDLEGGAEYALYRDDTDFCSYGERRADDKTEESRP